ncbi:NUDIX hydrolase [Hathewaya histolytica]|uniref:ADP-ribose pyrophosphatase n=1 Tax=Hathewaya histolytica TaxID=1498 RepID=A0A4U9RHL0_HATHI|nr:NUDIX hydrolase [Hathewaya histolytica]VTQ88280.1 ADP-ribose pyrophosphatase [Hathewaya histolytica]
MEFLEKTLEKEEIFKGKIVDLSIHTVELPNGKKSKREIINHPGAVAIVAFTKENKILMVRQFRKPLEKVLLEIPAGKLEHNEDIKDCALRELEEETGFIAGELEYLGKIHTSAGFCNECIHIFKATKLGKGTLGGDEDEFISTEEYSLDDVKNMVKSGEITDAKTISSLMYL